MPEGLESGFLLLLPAVPLVVGGLMIALGRSMMLRLPSGAECGSVLLVATGLSWLRFVLLVVSAAALLFAAGEKVIPARGPLFDWAGRAFGLAVLAGFVAEASVVSAMAVVSAEMPSRTLRRRAVAATLVLQLLAALWVAMLVCFTYLDLMRELVPPQAAQPGARAGAAPQGLDPEKRALFVTVLLGFLFLLQVGYAYLHYSLYSAGQFAGQTDGDRDS